MGTEWTDPFNTPERRALRELTRDFVTRDVLPDLDEWERAGELPLSLHERAAAAGLLGIGFPEEVGGSGGDLIDGLVMTEELIQTGASGGLAAGLFTHGIALPHMVVAGDPEQIERFVRPVLEGRAIASLAITEPDGGSDVAALRTRAERDGDEYVVNGSKIYITSGVRADWVVVGVRTGGPGFGGISLIVVPSDTPGSASSDAWRRSAGTARTPPSWPSRTAACRPPTWSARLDSGLHPDRDAVRGGTAVHRRPGLRHRPALPGPRARVGADAPHVRQAPGRAPGGPPPAGRDGPADRRRAHLHPPDRPAPRRRPGGDRRGRPGQEHRGGRRRGRDATRPSRSSAARAA